MNINKLLSNPNHILCELTRDDFKLAKEIWGDNLIDEGGWDANGYAKYIRDCREKGISTDGLADPRVVCINVAWKWHLQQLIISPDPVAYIKENTL